MRRNVTLDRRRWLHATSALTVASVLGCAPRHFHRGVQIGLVTDVGGLGDHSFADAANDGLQQAVRRYGVHGAVLQSRSPADYQPNLMTFANLDFDLIFAGAYDQANDLREVAARFPREHFAILDSVVTAPNVTSMTFKSEEGSFLAGALAAMQSTTKTLGFLGGIDVPVIRVFEVGFTAGARLIDPAVRVLVKYVGDFNDVPAGSELAALMFGNGADIVYAAAGKSGLGAIQQVRNRSGAFVIGVDSDQDGLVPGKILTSVLKRIDRSIFLLSEQTALGKPHPALFAVGLADEGVGLTEFRYTRALIGVARLARLARVRAAIVAGRIRVPKTHEELAAFRAPPL